MFYCRLKFIYMLWLLNTYTPFSNLMFDILYIIYEIHMQNKSFLCHAMQWEDESKCLHLGFGGNF